MNKIIDNQSKCCGCTACMTICPKKAIEMKYDEKGFLYPVINKDLCINCGLCEKVCDFDKFSKTENEPRCFAIRSKDENEVRTSRSGAIFIELAKWVLDKEGVIFGCELVDTKTIVHKYEFTREGVNKFKGSKYVQSDMQNCFEECIHFLLQGKYVLFSGTGCQIHGLISLLELKKISTEKLVTVDIVCHGVPSPIIWEKYVDYWNNHAPKTNMEIVGVNFRDKGIFGWRAHKESFLWNNNTTTTANYTNNFYAHIMFRESCYNCPYTTPNRKSDFTIADYWGIENNAPRFDDDKGVSLLLVHSKKAAYILEDIKENTDYQETKLCSSLQPNLVHSSVKGKDYDKFWRDYKKLSTNSFIKKYFFPSKFSVFCNKVINKIK